MSTGNSLVDSGMKTLVDQEIRTRLARISSETGVSANELDKAIRSGPVPGELAHPAQTVAEAVSIYRSKTTEMRSAQLDAQAALRTAIRLSGWNLPS